MGIGRVKKNFFVVNRDNFITDSSCSSNKLTEYLLTIDASNNLRQYWHEN